MEGFEVVVASPLMKGIPTAMVIGALAWTLTEALTSWLAEKYRPTIAVILGVAMGYVTHRASLVDFGGGPDGWLAALVIGAIGGALAPAAHPLLKKVPPFSYLANLTPSGQAATASAVKPPTGGGA